MFLINILGLIMRFLYNLFGNYGIAIILFTLFSKIVLLPMSIWVQKNSIKMVKMQPDVNKIKINYFGDKDRIAEEQDKLYKKEKYNAFASLIPLIIQILLLTFFYYYMRGLIEQGKLYIALPPLYKLDYGKKHFYAYTDEELESIKKENSGKYSIQRYKGLGEMNADQLWETTMNPDTRSLIRVNITDAALAEKRVSVLMGDKVEPRKEWINRNVEFTMEDNYRA